ncbi:lipase maturation factor family protein [Natronomonas salina]|uniref:lipase maturation factor family protein n=1 Tax=Natronomonas salina TaxID=1710540 RepID=UPI0015B4A7C2|nr:lipase maturation factor family protein [Natronomonas salina]QLD90275.1 lipase maturation factor family protein [Natronomonas salina]
MELPWAESYWLARFAFQRGLALIYLLGFLVAATQFRPLAGEDGLLPIENYRERWDFRERPSLFHLVPDDRAVAVTAWTGVGLSALAVLAVPYWLPDALAVPASMALWALLWLLYLSFVNAGQTFYGYGWESMLLETGFLAVFLGAGDAGPPFVVILLLKWVLFRNMFGAGLIKLRGDDCWRELTCMDYHYETQPIPNPLSWHAHHLPDRFHRVETLGNHVVELAVPFLYFAPQPWAAAAGLATVGFQLWLMLTGNFSWLNALTLVLAIPTFGDGVVQSVLPATTPAVAPTPTYLQALALLVAAVVVYKSVEPTRNMLSTSQVMNTSFDPLHLVNSYGAFGRVTRERYEVVIQGTRDDPEDDPEWETYTFPGKPTDPGRRPPQLAPYHLRLDWQLWFAAMSSTPHRHPWFSRLLEKLLEGDEAVRSLLKDDPFPEEPPTHVRAVRYRYRYTTPEERRETGRWWHRERSGPYVRPVSLEELRSGSTARRRRF